MSHFQYFSVRQNISIHNGWKLLKKSPFVFSHQKIEKSLNMIKNTWIKASSSIILSSFLLRSFLQTTTMYKTSVAAFSKLFFSFPLFTQISGLDEHRKGKKLTHIEKIFIVKSELKYFSNQCIFLCYIYYNCNAQCLKIPFKSLI